MKVTFPVVVLVIFTTAIFISGYLLGNIQGCDAGARQMARHLLNPRFTTESFVVIAEAEK